MEAAQIRGLAFTSLNDLVKPEPFWTIDNKIYSHVLTVSNELFKELLNTPRAKIIWISVGDVLFKDWHSAGERQRWNDIFIKLLDEIALASVTEQEKHILKEIFE